MTNAEWLEFLQDLRDLEVLIREIHHDPFTADTVHKARALLIDWNPERRESIKRCLDGQGHA